jgi:tRNA(fMet)-specific endonuclease VapC
VRSTPPAPKKTSDIELFLEAVDVLLPDEATPELYGRIFAQLAQAGTLIPQNDIWIATLALRAGLPLATSEHHFQHVAGLTVLVW